MVPDPGVFFAVSVVALMYIFHNGEEFDPPKARALLSAGRFHTSSV